MPLSRGSGVQGPVWPARGRESERYFPVLAGCSSPGTGSHGAEGGVAVRTRVGFVFLPVLALVAALSAPMAAPASSAAIPASPASLAEGVPAFGHVFLIIGENTTYSHLTAVNAPYLLGTIRPSAAWLTRYYAATHWSQANYVALVTGQFTGCEQKDGGAACHQNIDNLFHQLDLAGLSWKVWLEAGTAKCDTGAGGSCTSNTPCPLTGFYTTGNPPILFDDIEGPGGVWSPTTPSQECLANDIPAGTPDAGMATFNTDLATGQVARFNMVIPNGCDDGEANCKPVNNRYTQFDDFLAQEIPKIEASPAFGSNGVIIVTYDEDERAGGVAPKNGFGSGGHVACAIISPLAAPGTYGQTYYHYSLLRTLEDGFGLGPYLGNANAVTPVASIWRAPAS
jgi:Phosphoesterase family